MKIAWGGCGEEGWWVRRVRGQQLSKVNSLSAQSLWIEKLKIMNDTHTRTNRSILLAQIQFSTELLTHPYYLPLPASRHQPSLSSLFAFTEVSKWKKQQRVESLLANFVPLSVPLCVCVCVCVFAGVHVAYTFRGLSPAPGAPAAHRYLNSFHSAKDTLRAAPQHSFHLPARGITFFFFFGSEIKIIFSWSQIGMASTWLWCVCVCACVPYLCWPGALFLWV